MGLYLCVLDDAEEEVDGVDVGAYGDYGTLIDTVTRDLEHGQRGLKYPTLALHSDCDGQWSPQECADLERELVEILDALRSMAPKPLPEGWQRETGRVLGLRPKNLADSFIDVDGRPLLERILDLCRLAQERRLPVLFQ